MEHIPDILLVDANQIQLFYRNSNTATVGLTIKETDLDRSVNNKGLEVHGTITKSAVATGADLVAYSGFSNSTNYLSQPLNSDLAMEIVNSHLLVGSKKQHHQTLV